MDRPVQRIQCFQCAKALRRAIFWASFSTKAWWADKLCLHSQAHCQSQKCNWSTVTRWNCAAISATEKKLLGTAPHSRETTRRLDPTTDREQGFKSSPMKNPYYRLTVQLRDKMCALNVRLLGSTPNTTTEKSCLDTRRLSDLQNYFSFKKKGLQFQGSVMANPGCQLHTFGKREWLTISIKLDCGVSVMPLVIFCCLFFSLVQEGPIHCGQYHP